MQHQATASERSRIKLIDLLRTLSILAVMSLHFSFSETQHQTGTIDGNIFNFLDAFARQGEYGVLLFFVVSGFVISRMIHIRYGSVCAVNVKDFYLRRIARIWPLLVTVVSTALCLVWLANCGGKTPSSGPFYEVLSPDAKNFDGPFFASLCTFTNNILIELRPKQYGLQWLILWSIAVEEQFYLFFPLILRFLGNTHRLVVCLLVLISLGPLARWLCLEYGTKTALLTSFGSYDLLSMGILLFLACERLRPRLKQSGQTATALFGVGAIITIMVYVLRDQHNVVHTVLAPTLFGLGATMMILGGLSLKWMDKLPPIFTFPGELSYGLYLYHPLLMLFFFTNFASLHMPRVQFFALYIAISIIWGYVSFRMFESPLNRLIYASLSKYRRAVGPATTA